MIRRNESPRRLGRAGLAAVVLAAGAALPLAPTLAQQDDVDPAAEPQQEHRTVIVTPSDPSAPAADVKLDVAPADFDVSLNIAERPSAFSPDLHVIAADDVTVERQFDSRTGQVIEVQGKTLRIVPGTDLDQARAEVERARANLAAAEHRLRKMEAEARTGGGKNPKLTLKVDPGPDKRKQITVRRAPATAPGKGADVRSYGWTFENEVKQPAADQEKRIDQLEQKLDQINEMLQEMRDSRNREGEELGVETQRGPVSLRRR